MDTVRVFRLIEYVGPRDEIERVLSRSIHGEMRYTTSNGDTIIKAATLGTYPEIMETKEDNDGTPN